MVQTVRISSQTERELVLRGQDCVRFPREGERRGEREREREREMMIKDDILYED